MRHSLYHAGRHQRFQIDLITPDGTVGKQAEIVLSPGILNHVLRELAAGRQPVVRITAKAPPRRVKLQQSS